MRAPATVLLLFLTALVPSLPATAALAEEPPGTISGTVTAAYGGGTLNDACVSAFPSDDPSAPEVAGTFTADDGSYRLTLPPGSYQIEFHGDCMGGHEYAPQWWSGVTDRSGASSVLVTASQEVANVDAALATSLPGRPTSLSSSPGIRAVTLTWSPPANSGATSITGYDIYRAVGPYYSTRDLVASDVAGTNYGDSGLSDRTTYAYYISAVNGAGAGDVATVSAHTYARPDVPQGLEARVASSTDVVLSWRPPVDDGGQPVTDYNVYRSTDASSNGSAIASDVTTGYLVDSGLSAGTTYYYTVTATSAVGEGNPSPEVSAVPYGPPSVTITSHPAAATSAHEATFTFTTRDPGNRQVSTQCVLDHAAAANCSSPVSYSGLANGQHVFRVVATATSGQTSPESSYQWFSDDVAPTHVTVEPLPTARLRRSLSLVVDAVDSGSSGLQTYDMRYRTAAWNGRFGGYVYPSSWQRWPMSRFGFSGLRGHTYCFSARARDKAGNTSPWSPPRCTTIALDDRALLAGTGWVRARNVNDFATTSSTSSHHGATLTLHNAAVRHVALVVRECSRCGAVAIYLGGHYWSTVHTASTRTHFRRLILLPALGRLHTLTITLKVATRGRPVFVDGLAVSRV